jgi:molecular chaperone IbpA
MRNTTTIDTAFLDLFRDLNRFSVGFEPTFRMLDQVRNSSTAGYPPYDLEKLESEKDGVINYRLSMAVAGFAPEDISVVVQDGQLVIEGKSEKESAKTYLHKGIAGRSFRRTFYLANWVDVVESSLENGVLTVDLRYEMPESMKPKKIPVLAKTSATLLDSKV